jgi:TPR repeat protein
MTQATARHYTRMLAGVLLGAVVSTLLSVSHAALLPGSAGSAPGAHWLPHQIGVSESSEQFYSQGVEAYRTGDHADAVRWWEAAAERGHWRAQYNLGSAFAAGVGVTIDYRQAAYWWGLAAGQGITDAQYNLGVLYYEGRGVAQNLPEAVSWWQRAALAGDPAAQFRLGLLAALGEGTPVNYQQAEWWWRQAATKGFEPAIQGLALIKAQQAVLPQGER